MAPCRLRARRRCATLVLTMAAASACGADDSEGTVRASTPAAPSTQASMTSEPGPIDGVTATVVLTRQRDLVGRGFVNVRTVNASGYDLHVIERELAITHFASPGPRARSSSVRDGRTINLQTAYGEAGECDDRSPVEGVLRLRYTIDDESDVHEAALPLAGTEVLDTIRSQRCTEAAARDSIDVSFGDATIDGETVTVGLNLTHRAGGDELTVSGFEGTVLFGVEAAPGSVPAVVGDAQPSPTIPLQFRVNRCDPHALGETTLKYAVNAYVSARDGEDPVPVALDVDTLIPALDEILQLCVDASGDG